MAQVTRREFLGVVLDGTAGIALGGLGLAEAALDGSNVEVRIAPSPNLPPGYLGTIMGIAVIESARLPREVNGFRFLAAPPDPDPNAPYFLVMPRGQFEDLKRLDPG